MGTISKPKIMNDNILSFIGFAAFSPISTRTHGASHTTVLEHLHKLEYKLFLIFSDTIYCQAEEP
jgi:hypothetical protein